MALKGKFEDARKKLLDTMLSYGLAGIDVVKQIQQEILSISADDRTKMMLIEKLGDQKHEFKIMPDSSGETNPSPPLPT